MTDIVELQRLAGIHEDKWDGVPMYTVEHHTSSSAAPFLMDGPLRAVLKEVQTILNDEESGTTNSLTAIVIKPMGG